MPAAPKHFSPLDSFSRSTSSVLPLPFSAATSSATNTNPTLIAAPSPPLQPPSQSHSLRYPIPATAPPLATPCSAPRCCSLSGSSSQGSASCPLTLPPPSQQELDHQDHPSMIMSPHHQDVVAAQDAGSVAAAGRPSVQQVVQCQGQGVHLSLPESVQMPGSPMMTNSFGTPSSPDGRHAPLTLPMSSSSIGAFARTAMVVATATDASKDLDVDHDAVGNDDDDVDIDVDDDEHGMDVDADDAPAVVAGDAPPNALLLLLAIDGLHGHCSGDANSLELQLEADGRRHCRDGVATNALGLGSVQRSFSCSSPSSSCPLSPSPLLSASANHDALDALHFDPALLCDLDDSLLLPSVHPTHVAAAVLPAQHSLELAQTQHQHKGAMSTSVMSTPSSTHPRSTPLGTPTSPPLASTPAATSSASGTGCAAATNVDQLIADMFSSGSVPTQHLSEPSAADQALVDALLSTAADLYPALQPTASAVPDPDLFAFLSAVPEDELQAMLTAADAVLDEDDDDHAIVASAALPASSLPMSAFQSPMPQPEDRLLTDEDEDDDTSSLPGSAFAPPPANPHQDDDSDQEDHGSDDLNDDDAYNVRYGQRVIQVRNLEEGEVSGLSPPMGVLNDFPNTSSSSDVSDAEDHKLPVTPPRGRSRPYPSLSPTRSDDVIPPPSDLFAAAPLPSAPGPNINALFERHVVPTLVASDTESVITPSPLAAPTSAHDPLQDDEHEFGSPAAMPVFDDTTTLGAPASTMHQLRFAPLTVWTTAPLPFPQHLQYDAPPTPTTLPPMRPPSAASTASTTNSTTTSALIDALPWGQAEVVDSPYRRRRPRKPSMRVYPRYQPPQTHAQYEPSSLQAPMSPASPSSSQGGGHGYTHGYMSPPPPPPPPAYHMAASGSATASASASSALPSPHGSNESAPGTGTVVRGMSPPPLASTAWAASAGYSGQQQQQQQQQQQMRSRNQEYTAAAQSSGEHRSRDRYGRSAGGW